MLSACALLMLAACGDGAVGPEEPETVQIAFAAPSFARATISSVTPPSASLETGATVQLVATDASGASIEARWSSSDPAVATVSGAGLVIGVAPGSATITARTRNRSATASVAVVAPAATLPPPPPPPSGPSLPAACSGATYTRLVEVSAAQALHDALRTAQPGDLILLADGTYTGYFNVNASGTAEQRVTLCGTRGAFLQTGSLDSGHAIYMEGASYWTLAGFSAGSSMGGIAMVRGSHNVLQGLEVRNTGQHAIHVTMYSSNNVIRDNVIRDTGRRMPEYGEGVYVGSWSGHWCSRTNCEPDRSDRNQVIGNAFGPNVTAEHVQVMEGTTGGTIRGNTFDGTGMGAPNAPWADSWVAVMGSGYVVEKNRGSVSLRNGFEVWVEKAGWGNDNVFRNNTADVQASGYGFHVNTSSTGNVVSCGNTVTRAGSGFANVSCQ